MIPYTLVRSKRKTVAIYITEEYAIEVRAPLNMPKTEIDVFVKSKSRWIETNLAKRERLNKEKKSFSLNYGDSVLLCGKQYPIIPQIGYPAEFDGKSFYLPPGLPADDVKSTLVMIYKSQAEIILKKRVIEYASRMGVTPSAVRITNAKTRWGSCSGNNSINFSWRLIMAENDVIDYVVVHELAHIKEHSHSARFWAEVENILPYYKLRQKSLKRLQDRLSREDWD